MVRASLPVTSREQLRAAGFFEAYNAKLTEKARRELDGVVAASWLPIELAHEHFAALDAVGIGDSEVLALTRLTAERLHRAGLSIAFGFIRSAGLTPWTALPAVSKVWPRFFEGGCVGLQKLGPKDAHVVVTGHPLLRHRCHRIGIRAHAEFVLSLCAERGHVRELSYDAEGCTLTLLARWV